jgi:citronellol/citronellal dehydrogenase
MLSQLVLPDMIRLRRGAIVNISSGSAIGPGRAPLKDAQPVNGGTMYGAAKAALERFTQGLAQEVAPHNVAVVALSPSQVVANKLVLGTADPSAEPPAYMARAALLLATEPAEKVNGGVTYSQQILGEYGLLDRPTGRGATTKGSGYSQI